jgi:hypothetical protein
MRSRTSKRLRELETVNIKGASFARPSSKTESLNFNYLKPSVDANENHASGQVSGINGQLALPNFIQQSSVL